MPSVLCGLDCFDAPTLLTAGAVAREFSATLDPALQAAACTVEVYRLERVALDAPLAAGDAVLCRLPTWRFDLASLEELHQQLEDQRLEHESLSVKHARTKEAFMALHACMEAAEIDEKPPPTHSDGGGHAELQRLRKALDLSEKKQLETKATVMALRTEFMDLVSMMSDAGATGEASKFTATEFPAAMKENTRSPLTGQIGKPPSGDPNAPDTARHPHSRHASPPPVAHGGRRPAASPRTYRSPGAFSTPRPVGRARGVHQRGGHSAGASMHQRQVGEVM